MALLEAQVFDTRPRSQTSWSCYLEGCKAEELEAGPLSRRRCARRTRASHSPPLSLLDLEEVVNGLNGREREQSSGPHKKQNRTKW